MNSILEECKNLKLTLDDLRPIKKEDEIRIMQKFRLDWNYHSNHLEGNSLTYGETKALILFGITAQGKPLKDHFEVTGHDDAISWILSLVEQERPLSEIFIRELHTLILKESYEVNAITPEGNPTKKTVKIGEYKTTPNHVKTKTGEIFRFATPEETPILMNELIQWYNEKSIENNVNPILLASEFHYKYIRIHPFDDGNGRTVRILMNFILLRFGYPPVIVKTEDKFNYFAALRQADAGILKPFTEYIANNLKHSLEIMINGAKGGSIEEKDDLEKEIALLEQSVLAVGQPIKIFKDKKSLQELFTNTIGPTSNYFSKKSELMDRFYHSTGYKIQIDNSIIQSERDNFIELAKQNIKEASNRFILEYKYSTFNQVGFKEFNYTSRITYNCGLTKYSVTNDQGFTREKLYGEYLSESEIKSLVDETIKKHKEIIQNKVESLRNK